MDKIIIKNKKFINLEQQLVKVTAGSRMIRIEAALLYGFLLQSSYKI